jgi:hypothetical protein
LTFLPHDFIIAMFCGDNKEMIVVLREIYCRIEELVFDNVRINEIVNIVVREFGVEDDLVDDTVRLILDREFFPAYEWCD